jgi:DNA-3-methyladenine glycosylase I
MKDSIENNRCPWCGSDPLYVYYHDVEWGVPEFDDQALFAKLILDGAQAGLSWITILRRRDAYFEAFDQLDPEIIVRYNESKIERLMQDASIIRNRSKIVSTVGNARAYMNMSEAGQSFSRFLWDFVDGKPITNAWKEMHEVPAQTPLSVTISKELKARGFKFVGPTIIYAFMQATGMVNDHLTTCFRYPEIIKIS